MIGVGDHGGDRSQERDRSDLSRYICVTSEKMSTQREFLRDNTGAVTHWAAPISQN